MATTVAVGKIPQEVRNLCMQQKMRFLPVLMLYGLEILCTIFRARFRMFLLAGNYGIVRDLCGHGVGYEVHEDPYVLNYILPKRYMEPVLLRPGMVLAIEPMATFGSPEIVLAKDGLTISTRDKSLAAQFEHTVAVTETGHEILTLRL